MSNRHIPFMFVFVLLTGHLVFGEEIVVIGDSLSCGPFGIQLVKNLSAAGKNNVTLYCAVSAKPEHWINGQVPRGSPGCMTLTSDDVKKRFPKDLCPDVQLHPRRKTVISHSCGSVMPKLSDLVSRHPRAQFVAALGTNSLGYKRADKNYTEFVRQIKKSSGKCVWVGPPHCRPDQTNTKAFSRRTVRIDEEGLDPFTDSLQNHVANNVNDNGQSKCDFIDSRPMTQIEKDPSIDASNTVDGVHRNDCSGKIWADKVVIKLKAIAQNQGAGSSSQSGVK